MIMKKFISYLLWMALLWTSCQTEEIVEPELLNGTVPETAFGEFSVRVENLTDVSAALVWDIQRNTTGRFDIYLNDTYVGTQQPDYHQEFMLFTLYNLSPTETYRARVRWIVSDDEVKFAETTFKTMESFLQGAGMAFVLDDYIYTSYEVLSALPEEDGTLYTLSAKTDFSFNTLVVLLKTDLNGNVLWKKEHPLSADPLYAEYRETKLLPDGSYLLLTTKHAICTSVGGQTLWIHEFLEPEEKKLFLNDAYLMDNGNLMVVGSSHRKWGKDDNLWEEAYIGIVSPDGTLLHETYQDLHKQNRLDKIEPMVNGNFLVCGVTGDDLGIYSDGDFYTNVVDATGTILEMEQHLGYRYKEVNCSLKDKEGNFYILGTETRPIDWIDTQISLIRLNPEGKLISRKCYDKRGGDGFLSPVSMNFQGDLLVITTQAEGSSEVLIIDKECNDKYHWGMRRSSYFIRAEYEEPYLMCLDNYGVIYLYNLEGYKEYPYFDLSE